MPERIVGVLTAIVTPFAADGGVSAPALVRQVERQIAHRNGIFCSGTNGEFFVLDRAEKVRVAEVCAETIEGRVPFVAHIGEVSTDATISLGRDMAALGVDAVSVITPWFVPLKQHELEAHFARIADALTVPVYLYNIPGRTGNTIAPETAAKLARHGNIVGIKDSAGDWASIAAYLDATRDIDGFDVLTGPDHLAHDGFLAGCAACISGLANVAPQWVSRTWERFRDGDVAGSRAAQDVISGIRKDLYAVGFAPAAVKKAANLLGEDVGDSRYPTQFSADDVAAIRAVIAKYDLAAAPERKAS